MPLAKLAGWSVVALLVVLTPAVIAQEENKAPDGKDAKQPDLKKQVEDALKELDKLDKLPDVPDAARQGIDDLRKRLRGGPPGGIGGFRNGGGFGGFGGFASGFGAVSRNLQTRLGVGVQQPAAVLVEQLDLPAHQGLVVQGVLPDSPAARAGIRVHDILLELAGKPVPSDVASFQRKVRELKTDTPYDAIVLRRGKRETVHGVKLGDLRPEAEGLVPNFEVPGIVPPGFRLQPLPPGNRGRIQAEVGGSSGESMRVSVRNDVFSVEYKSNANRAGSLSATIEGRRDMGQSRIDEIHIVDGSTDLRMKNVAEVPERYQPIVRRMLESVR